MVQRLLRLRIPLPEASMANIPLTTEAPAEVALISWSAVIAGAVAAAAVTLILLAFGVGLGLAVISPWSDEGVSSTTFHVASGIYLVVVAMLASTVGGLLAGRLRARWVGVHQDEAFFRDTAHGFLAWALATILSASVLGGATTHILAGASAGSIPAAGAVATATPADTYVDLLLRPGQQNTPPNVDIAATRQELSRLLTNSSLRRSDMAAADRAYVARVVSVRTGLPQADAERRVAEVTAQAKTAADEARKAAVKLAFWLAASMLAGAFAASLAAAEGGAYRDEEWWAPGWRRTRQI